MGRMTESLKSEAVRLYFEENREESEIAEALNISMRQVKTVLGDLARLETYKKRSEAAKLRAQICVNKSAEEAARRQTALLLDGEVNETISQRAAKDILDRAGRARAEGKQERRGDSVCIGRAAAGHARKRGGEKGGMKTWSLSWPIGRRASSWLSTPARRTKCSTAGRQAAERATRSVGTR